MKNQKKSRLPQSFGRKIDKLTSVVMEFADGKKAAFTCGMTLATNQDRRLDCLEIDGTKGKYYRNQICIQW